MTFHATLHAARGGINLPDNDPIPAPDPAVKYWVIERKSKRPRSWVHVIAFWATEDRANSHFTETYTNKKFEYRMRELQIGKKS